MLNIEAMTNADLKKIGENIRKAREKKKMSQTELADRVGWDLPNVSRLESGGTNATAKTLIKVAKAIGINPGEFFKGI